MRTGSAPRVSIPTTACPASWNAVRSRSRGERTMPRRVPSRIFSGKVMRQRVEKLSRELKEAAAKKTPAAAPRPNGQ